ncbi:hypothetical protein [Salinibacter ruber]|nr:hypothetical protein [Salinibacter ruber]
MSDYYRTTIVSNALTVVVTDISSNLIADFGSGVDLTDSKRVVGCYL